ncbi:MAG: DUF7487 domain-containing protein [Nitrosopumilaceae archaeon]
MWIKYVYNNNLTPPLCKTCGEIKTLWNYKTNLFREYCSHKCANTSPTKQEKSKQTMLQRFGVEHNWCFGTHSREKQKQTMLERHGVVNPSQSKKIKENKKETCLKKYGVENPLQSEKVKQKIKQTNLKKYGVEYAVQLKEIKEKKKQTNLKKYGVEYAVQLKEIKEKKKQTNLKKYGVETVNQKHMVEILPLLGDYNWIYNQYTNKKKTVTQIAKELNIDTTTMSRYLRNHNIIIKHINKFSYKCMEWLELVIQKQNISIQHARNIGEYLIPNTRYHADGYCKETNTVYEFHGDMWHGNPNIFESDELCNPFSDLTAGELYQRTIERENKIKQLGYNVITIWESDWNHNSNERATGQLVITVHCQEREVQ